MCANLQRDFHTSPLGADSEVQKRESHKRITTSAKVVDCCSILLLLGPQLSIPLHFPHPLEYMFGLHISFDSHLPGILATINRFHSWNDITSEKLANVYAEVAHALSEKTQLKFSSEQTVNGGPNCEHKLDTVSIHGNENVGTVEAKSNVTWS